MRAISTLAALVSCVVFSLQGCGGGCAGEEEIKTCEEENSKGTIESDIRFHAGGGWRKYDAQRDVCERLGALLRCYEGCCDVADVKEKTAAYITSINRFEGSGCSDLQDPCATSNTSDTSDTSNNIPQVVYLIASLCMLMWACNVGPTYKQPGGPCANEGAMKCCCPVCAVVENEKCDNPADIAAAFICQFLFTMRLWSPVIKDKPTSDDAQPAVPPAQPAVPPAQATMPTADGHAAESGNQVGALSV